MPKVLVRDPAWLVGSGTSGLSLFQPNKDASTKRQTPSATTAQGALRRIAHRGTEVFVAVGNELRWSDLARQKDTAHSGGKQEEQTHRVLKTPVHREITQLSISPSGDYIAIITSHTCHICILPAPSHLNTRDASPLRLKSFQLGPTAHVLEQAPLVSAIWHPLSPSGNCLVTVTHDACVRLWELNSSNRSSFDEPALAVDLKKLGNATSSQADLSASKYGTNRGYSPDDVEMQVAGACFGGQGLDDEHGWASMTLWVAMTEGDVYALCPFLPSKWFAPASLLPTLSTSVAERATALRVDEEATEWERRVVDEQTRWLGHIDAQEPLTMTHSHAEFDDIEVFSRPDCLSAIPKLQGPFFISPEPDFGEITDIYVVGPKVDDDALYDMENEDMMVDEGLSVSIVCLATSTNEVHVCLDLDGVEAEWLPRKRSRSYTLDEVPNEKELLLFETVDLANSDSEDDGWPVFTSSPLNRYDLFVTFPSGVCGLSFRPWIGALEDELTAPTASGAGLRLDVVLESSGTLVDQPIKTNADESNGTISAAISVLDPSIGFILLTSANDTPYASILDAPSEQGNHAYLPDAPTAIAALAAPEPRAPYRPPQAFDQASSLPQLLKMARERGLLGPDPTRTVRFSPATLQLMTEAHRIMSTETHRLGLAAADLFRRCERMRSELQEQIRKVAEIMVRVDNVTGRDDGNTEDRSQGQHAREKIDLRVQQAQQKTSLLNTRVDNLRRRLLLLGGRELNAKEVRFAEEVRRLHSSVLPAAEQLHHSGSFSVVEGDEDEDERSDDPRQSENTTGTAAASLAARFEAVNSLHERLARDADEAVQLAQQQQQQQQNQKDSTAEADNEVVSGSGGARRSTLGSSVNGGFRRQKLAQVMALLERESALIEAVGERLSRLSV